MSHLWCLWGLRRLLVAMARTGLQGR